MGLLKKIFMLAFLVILTWVGLTFYSGWQMYEDALAACPLEVRTAPTPPSKAAIFAATASLVGFCRRV